MIKEAIEYLVELGENSCNNDIIEVCGRTFFGKEEIRREQPGTLDISTLTGVADFVDSEKLNPEENIIHVVSHREVNVISKLKRIEQGYDRRDTFCSARTSFDRFRFASWMSQEQFLIELVTKFVYDDENTKKLYDHIKNIRSVNERESNDNGYSQSVRSMRKITTDVEIQNPIRLTPYRTFVEIEQPSSMYYFRIKELDEQIEISLFDCGGNFWELVAMKDIREWLQNKLPGFDIIS